MAPKSIDRPPKRSPDPSCHPQPLKNFFSALAPPKNRLLAETKKMSWEIKSPKKALSLIAAGADIDVRDERGNTPLILSVVNGHTEIARALILKGADVNASNQGGGTALIYATKQAGKADLVQLLLGHGAETEMRDNTGRTARDWAVSLSLRDIAQLLEEQAQKNRETAEARKKAEEEEKERQRLEATNCRGGVKIFLPLRSPLVIRREPQ